MEQSYNDDWISYRSMVIVVMVIITTTAISKSQIGNIGLVFFLLKKTLLGNVLLLQKLANNSESNTRIKQHITIVND